MTNAILIARVSSKEQAEEGYSLQSQVKLLEDYAMKRDITITKSFVIPESARGKVERKLFAEAQEYLRQHKEITLILCEKVDRITRNFKDAEKLNDWLEEDANRQIHFVKQSLIVHQNSKSHEKFQWDIYLVLARQYGNNLSEEAKKGLDEKAAEGWYPGNKKPGYKTVGEAGRKCWVIDDSPGSDAPFIRRAFELFDTGEHTLLSVTKVLFDEGWSKHGKRVGKTTLHGMLTDCFNCGEFMWNGKHHPNANHESLISRELFQSVQEKLRRKITGKYRKRDFLFKDLMICGECRRSVTADERKGHRYYHCTRFNTNCTQATYTKEAAVEEQLLGIFDFLRVQEPRMVEWLRKALKEHHSEESQYHEQVMTGLTQKLTMAQKRLDAIYDDKLDGKSPQSSTRRSSTSTPQNSRTPCNPSSVTRPQTSTTWCSAPKFSNWLRLAEKSTNRRPQGRRSVPSAIWYFRT
jgi:DNA invertase Pin-like site-specific DNA recombinase